MFSMFLKVDIAGAERICSGRLFQATVPCHTKMPGYVTIKALLFWKISGISVNVVKCEILRMHSG